MRRNVACLIALLMLGPVASAFSAEKSSGESPNVIVFFIDDMGYADPSCFGNSVVKTPNIDRLAHEGIKLTNFYVNSPICSASRVALTTGQYPQRYRIHSFFASRERNRERKMPNWLDPDAPTLAKFLKQAGYHTAHFGKWHMGGGRDVGDAPLPRDYGFDQSLVSFEGLGDRILWQPKKNPSWTHGRGKTIALPKHKTTETYVNRAIDFIRDHRQDSFYVRVFPNDVHDAHEPSAEQLARWKVSESEYDNRFYAVLEEMDRQIGRVLNTLDELQLTDDTLVIFTSDNGPTDWPKYYREGVDPPGFTGPLFGRKWSLYEGGIRMPFLARWPGKIPAGAVNENTVMAAIDILPSVASLTGVRLPAELQLDGIDLSAALLGDPIEREQPLYWEYGVHGSIEPGKEAHISPHLAMRDGPWKLLCNPDGTQTQLFNLKNDIGESQNLADSHPEVVKRMKPKLQSWWETMNSYYDAIPQE